MRQAGGCCHCSQACPPFCGQAQEGCAKGLQEQGEMLHRGKGRHGQVGAGSRGKRSGRGRARDPMEVSSEDFH
eukprot:1158549-Pelagomonas_calceolata.AAC.1